jgi:hypothetical protein
MVSAGKVHELWHPDWVARSAEFCARTNWSPQITVSEGFFETFRALQSAGILPARAV